MRFHHWKLPRILRKDRRTYTGMGCGWFKVSLYMHMIPDISFTHFVSSPMCALCIILGSHWELPSLLSEFSVSALHVFKTLAPFGNRQFTYLLFEFLTSWGRFLPLLSKKSFFPDLACCDDEGRVCSSSCVTPCLSHIPIWNVATAWGIKFVVLDILPSVWVSSVVGSFVFPLEGCKTICLIKNMLDLPKRHLDKSWFNIDISVCKDFPVEMAWRKVSKYYLCLSKVTHSFILPTIFRFSASNVRELEAFGGPCPVQKSLKLFILEDLAIRLRKISWSWSHAL